MRRGLALVLLVACASPNLPPSVPLGTGEVRFRRAGGVLHIAVDMQESGIASVFVQSGDRLYILHASAALGTGIYAREGKQWRRVQDFDYRCRDNRDAVCRKRFRDRDGWIANVDPNGGADRGFDIDVARFAAPGARSLQIAVTYLKLSPVTPYAWPATVDDDAGAAPAQQGFLPEIIRVRPERWTTVRI